MSAASQKNDNTMPMPDFDALARNSAALMQEGAKVLTAYFGGFADTPPSPFVNEELRSVVETFSKLTDGLLSNPDQAAAAQQALIKGYADLWSNTLKRFAGEPAEVVAKPDSKDARFSDPEWSNNPWFDAIKQAYLLNARFAESLPQKAADKMDPHTREKAEFYMRQLAAALAPSNFLLTNPEILRETLESNAGNLVRGMHNLAEDISNGKGKLKLKQTDGSKFELGHNIACTPGHVVFRNDLIELIQYTPSTEKVLKRPLLIIPPWINKYYILDLTPEKSFIRWAVEQGHTVFCVSWVNPDSRHRHKTFDDYMYEGVLAAVSVVCDIARTREINAIGYCVGGTLLATTLAYMASHNDTRIASATFFTTQVDFTEAGDLKVFIDEAQIRSVESEMKAKGYLDGQKMAMAFNMLRPNDLIWPYVINNYLKGKDPFPFDLLHWNSDSTRMAAANHSAYLRNCYLNNLLAEGKMTVAGEAIDLRKITLPMYSLATREDHIAPARSVFKGMKMLGAPVRFVLAGSGHIAGVVNPPIRKKYNYWVGVPLTHWFDGSMDEWLNMAVNNDGSWWPDWQNWVSAQAPEMVAARETGNGGFPPLDPAPGTYVRMS